MKKNQKALAGRAALVLESRDEANRTAVVRAGETALVISPIVGGDYWLYRVMLSDEQAILGFPKFFTVGIGFAVEEDWNTNLPYTEPTASIYEHIKHNKGDHRISKSRCLRAIGMIQNAAAYTAARAASAPKRTRGGAK